MRTWYVINQDSFGHMFIFKDKTPRYKLQKLGLDVFKTEQQARAVAIERLKQRILRLNENIKNLKKQRVY